MLEIKNLSVHTDTNKIIKDFNFKFEQGLVYAIMGPNGAGKSTLVKSIFGDPAFKLSKGSKIIFKGENITSLKPNKKADKGLFLAYQNPVPLPGITVYELLQAVLNSKINPLDLKKKVDAVAEQLKINSELLERSLNEDFSGGEKKKMEILQMAVLNPSLIMLDEFDTGVDIDSLKLITDYINNFKDTSKSIILITHNARILKWIKPDFVLVVKDGKLDKVGDVTLAKEIDENGFEFPCCKICGKGKNPIECLHSPYLKVKE